MIILENIVKQYKVGEDTVNALKGINLEISRGDFICIAGNSGSGKTTLLNIIGCLDKSDGGSYRLDDCIIDNVSEKNLYKIRRDKIGFIFQSFNLILVLTAYENVEYPLILGKMQKSLRHELVTRALKEVSIYDRKDHLADQLSGGQRQRVAIARALAKRPPIILADEPTANLDSATGKNVIELMRKINKEDNTTFVFSTHDKEVMQAANKVIHLKDGMIISDQ